MDKINVQLYGGKEIFGGKETPLEADEILCDKYENCSFYKFNKCLRCRGGLNPTCKFGTNEVKKGYTIRAAKYYDFKNKYQKDDKYNLLEYPYKKYFAVISDYAFFNLKYFTVRKKRENIDEKWLKDINGYIISDDCFFIANSCAWIPISDLTNELLNAILSHKPKTLFDNKYISEYQDNIVPEIVNDIKLLLPQVWDKFVIDYPELASKQRNYVGREIYIDSLPVPTDFIYKGNKWHYNGVYVTCKEFNLGLWSPWWNKQEIADEITIKVNDKMTIPITDNSMVNEFSRLVE